MSEPIRVLMFGTFDILHPGHLRIFRQAKQYGDVLYVVIARDSTVIEVKGKPPVHDEETRRRQVENIPSVDHAVLGHRKDKYLVLEEIQPHIIVLGYDQENFTDKLEAELKKRKVTAKIIRLRPYKETMYKSSLLRKKQEQA